MGGNEHSTMVEGLQKLKNSHPKQQDAMIVTQGGQKYIQNLQKMDKKQYDQWHSTVGNVTKRPYSRFVNLPEYTGFVGDSKGCGSQQTGHAVANYPNFPYILSDVIKQRSKNNAPFKEKELYYLLYAMASAKKDALDAGEPVGDIRPENIYLSQGENVKIGSMYTYPNEKTAFEKFMNKGSPDYHVYLAPEDMKYASQGRLDNRGNDKSEIFAMGTTVMGAGLLDDMTSIYNYPSREFNYSEHKQKTNQWLQTPQYSQIFKSIVLNMSHPNPDKRMDQKELFQFLHQHEFNIVNKQQFLVTNPPGRLEEGVSTVRSTILRSRMK